MVEMVIVLVVLKMRVRGSCRAARARACVCWWRWRDGRLQGGCGHRTWTEGLCACVRVCVCVCGCVCARARRVAVDIGGYGVKQDPQTPKRAFDPADFPDPVRGGAREG